MKTGKMRLLGLALCAIAFSSCAETRLYYKGSLVAVIQGDALNVTVRSNDFYFHADSLIHASATAAAYTGLGTAIGAAGTAAATTAAILH